MFCGVVYWRIKYTWQRNVVSKILDENHMMSTEVWYEAIIQFLREIRPHYNENWFHLRKSDTRTIPTLVCSILSYWTVLWWGRTVSWFDRALPPWTSWQIRRIAGCPWPVMLGMCSPPPQVSDPDMHQGTCVTYVPWCMPGSLTIGFLISRWRRKRSRHSRCMRHPQFYVSDKTPIQQHSNGKLLFTNERDA